MTISTNPKKTIFTASDLAKGSMNEVFKAASHVPVTIEHRSFGSMYLVSDDWVEGIINLFNLTLAPVKIIDLENGTYKVENEEKEFDGLEFIRDEHSEIIACEESSVYGLGLIGVYDNPIVALSYAMEELDRITMDEEDE